MSTSSTSSYTPPGRLGNKSMDLGSDPRTNRKLLQALAPMGFDRVGPDPPVTTSSPMDQIKDLIAQFDTGFQSLYDSIPIDLPGDEKEPPVDETTRTITGTDGNEIKLHIFRKAGTKGAKLPAVVYTHGGGMTVINTYNKIHVRWLKSLALAGVVAIATDFRNAYVKGTHNPFPAGLNDCAAGVQYISAHKQDLGISKIVLQGESGGGNLAIATALKAKKEGWIDSIAGVYASIPAISNAADASEEELLKKLPSAVENHGYFLNAKAMAVMGFYYTPEKKDAEDPLAWPFHATEDDLKGLPPFYLSMDELDPLRDEGVAFYRKLDAAGVKVAAQVNLGITHGGSWIFRQAVPDFYYAVVDSVAAFAKRV